MPEMWGRDERVIFGGNLNPPRADQIEFTLLGPGFGETALVHVGSSNWIVVDSCMDMERQAPAALQYLSSIGVSPTSVKLIIATHWHDDHIRGLAQLLRVCDSASFCCSSAMGTKEFLAMVAAYNTRTLTNLRSGVREIDSIFRNLEAKQRYVKRAHDGCVLLRISAERLAHGRECTVAALSPSDKQVQMFYDEIRALLPGAETKHPVPAQEPNHLTVVVKIDIGETSLLLGGDLENTSDPERGWMAVLRSDTRTKHRAKIFKIPHHGSANAHNDDVWSTMLTDTPYAVLTPFNRLTKLPSRADVERINALSPNSFSSSKHTGSKSKRDRPKAVARQLKEMGVHISRTEPPLGGVTLRSGSSTAPNDWEVMCFGSACHLSEMYSE